MPVLVSFLRGVNVGGRNLVRMDHLRALYVQLALADPRTYLQSGNVVFRAPRQALPHLGKRIEDAIEQHAGFRPNVILRTADEIAAVIARNPFAGRSDIHPSKLAVTFLAAPPTPEARTALLRMAAATPEELRIDGCELFTYFPNGMGRPKLNWPQVERTVGVPATSRNWNTVTKLLDLAATVRAGS